MGRACVQVQKEFKDASGQVKNIDVKLFPWEELNYVDKVKAAFDL
jgi:S-adenosylmethionine synthetase